MASYRLQSITAAQAAAYDGAIDSLSFGAGFANQITVLYLGGPEQVSVSYGGLTVNFGPGLYGDQDLTFDSGARLFVGGSGADVAVGGPGDDALFMGAGADNVNGGDGADVLQGNQGADTLIGGAGNDSAFGGQDNDLILLGDGPDEGNWANGNKGQDTITGAGGADTLLGGQDADLVMGGGGADFLNGNLGDDTIRGGAGADTLIGEAGSDTLIGEGEGDLYVFGAGTSEVDVFLADRILDWTADDRIALPVHGDYMEFTVPVPTPGRPAPGYPAYDPSLPLAVNYFSMALGQADERMHIVGNHVTAPLRILAAQTGGDVMVFVDVDGDNHTDLSIILVGTSLSAIDAVNFV
jgi:hypothetical protein